MANKTAFLLLTLPEFQEFLNSWHDPVNQNMEDIDAWAKDLYDSLVNSSATATWSALRGSLGSLADRLDVSINADGTINLTNSPEILSLGTSSTKGKETAPDDDPRGRFDRSDFEIYDARQPFPGDRFVPITSSGPSAGFPEENLDSGIAARSADYGAKALLDGVGPVSSPQVPWAPGLVTGGGANFITVPGGEGIIRLNGGTAPAVLNIDGYLFLIRENIDFKWTGITPTGGNYVWFYVERVEANYNSSSFLYNQDAGYAAKDLRISQSGTAGVTSAASKLFTDASGKFLTATLGKVYEGDILVVDTTSAAGKYVIDTVNSDTSLNIRGDFKADVTGASWHIQNNHMPNIGAVETDSSPETIPAYAAGRVYIGRAIYNAGSDPTGLINYQKGGVFDSGWQATTAAGLAATPLTFNHNLGVRPTKVEIFLRASGTGEAYPPIVERRFMTDIDPTNLPNPVLADFRFHTQLVPSMRWHSSTTAITIRLLNQQNNNITPVASALFTDSGATDVTSGDIRVVCWR